MVFIQSYLCRQINESCGQVYYADTILWNQGRKDNINKTMRYEYTITDQEEKKEVVKAMSWKKMFKSLLLKTPKFTGWITYINKKGNALTKVINNGKVIH